MGKSIDTFIITFICGMIGIVLAFITYLLYVNGIVVDEYITATLTIENMMALIILAWTSLGVLLSAIS